MKTPLRGVGPPGDNEVFGLIMGDDHRYAMWDAAYVLGSLSSVDRREFEGHMAQCPACRNAVAELSGVPALLSQLDREEFAAIAESGDLPPATPEMSPELLPSLLAKVAWRRRRARAITWVASSAAAAVLAVGVFVGIQGHSPSVPPAQSVAASSEMAQVGTNLLTSTVQLSSQHWGTAINLKCVCLAPPYAHHDTLAMVVVGRDGSQTRLATWVAEPGHTATPAASISTPIEQIAAVQVVAADSGQVLLQRSL
ncbi:anti-sigma-L factor RslA [Mycobacterium montefiorense]|uniref:Anti-sigma-L factor RslA n=2 Tax=Mycobacterium montefiorense TaxID=154654 RepID=A0AA37PN73_9MYCO|nr:anti-sigma-L factor RslA [Mycobacterium montefiorense]GKU37834.1 anti-sigma-L factor RslA [Mycobacterium montefiorense]GKU42793.1 anti-sigma-L factor RslA [Mycobacterium montefiorense]GKU46330.1 anti-sigma-L factor RslA [Mycobacterium montefiorense]GKU51086.1 anti-sigma-L factor RslA [Mycobacterium montefiorense]